MIFKPSTFRANIWGYISRIILCVCLFSTGLPTAYAAELLPLDNRVDLWQQVQQDITSQKNSPPVAGDKNSSQLQFVLVKEITVGAAKSVAQSSAKSAADIKPSFEHYNTRYQGYPILNGRLVLAKNSQGELQQILGVLATDLASDLPNAKAAFIQDEKAVRSWLHNEYQLKHTIESLELFPAIFIDKGIAKPVYRISYRLISNSNRNQGAIIERPQLIVHAQTFELIKYWNGLAEIEDKLVTGQHVKGGGAGGNAVLGLNCYTPSPSLMAQCLAYQGVDKPLVSEVIFNNLNANNIFTAFDGYPFIVTQNGTDCWLKNDYVTSIKAERNAPNDTAFQYVCDATAEQFNKQQIDDDDWDFFSFSPINDVHFYAGIVMQMYDQYFRDIYPAQVDDCPQGPVSSGYCLKPIKQRANATDAYGAEMENANWDGEYTNYGNGNIWDMYSMTTIDIVAHEIGHAFTEWNTASEYSGQSGALNESFSDITTIAANEFFQRQLSGSYFTSLPYQKKRENQWQVGWDASMSGWGGRNLQRPSWNGDNIADLRDYYEGMSLHSAGGITSKLFYELIVRHGWGIEGTFKLMLEANTSCWLPQVQFVDAGTCLLLLTTDVNKKRQLDQTLHSVGIFSPQSDINPLPFEVTQLDNIFGYKVVLPQNIARTSINSIEVYWGDETPVKAWNKDSILALDNFLEASHGYTDAEAMLFSIVMTLDDGSEWQGYRNIYMRGDIIPAKDIIPDAFEITAAVDAPLAEMIYSPSIEVSGINTITKISIDNGEYSIDGAGFTSQEGLITNGQQVIIKLLSSPSYITSTQALLTIADVSAAFVITTAAVDMTPDAFEISAAADAPLAEMVYSPSIEVSGINTAIEIKIDKGEYSIDDGDFTTQEGLITNGQQVILRLLSSADYSTSTQMILTVGSESAVFDVTTLAESIKIDKPAGKSSASGGAISILNILWLLTLFFMLNYAYTLLAKKRVR